MLTRRAIIAAPACALFARTARGEEATGDWWSRPGVRGAGKSAQWKDAPQSTKDWFAKQQNQIGEVCCDVADGRAADDWRSSGADYIVTIDGEEFHVAAKKRVAGVNIMGVPLVWIYPANARVTTQSIRCFMPGFEG